jgi:hypothetical protein
MLHNWIAFILSAPVRQVYTVMSLLLLIDWLESLMIMRNSFIIHILLFLFIHQIYRQIDINREVEDQTNRIRMMDRVTAETSNTTNNIMRELCDQK